MKFVKGYTCMKKHVIPYEWRINNISTYSEKTGDDIEYKFDLESLKFPPGADEKIKWHLKLSSENEESEDKSWISLSIHYSAAQEFNVQTMYHLFIINNKNERVNVTEFRKYFRGRTDSYTHAEFVKKSDLEEKKRELLPNDSLTIGIELTIYGDPMMYSNSITLKEPTSHVIEDYRRLFETKEGCDVILKVGDEAFETHRTILMARNEIFFKLFTLATKEETNTREVITLTDIKPKIFKSFLEFIYTDQVTDIDLVVDDLLEIADKYLLDSLKDLCTESLLKGLKADNAIRVLSLAEKYNVPQLSEQVSEFIVCNAKDTANFNVIQFQMNLKSAKK
ncbi:Similar to spop: Speckle-type POZ protein (Xenopus tropicalis) [Cotesia congregata]|uniref:Similar to spop: Speckle-type POZ protein (Xenopus tropicalis) n=1 Tax=Cotesia congregata TaxID=51543 RepID=A0A8J2MG42_COTCN|nr:Similar to spop: Speckle-type POZ protein (Xenopus tropicalis) [Cotesia congregata]